jgi:hypothetical protein
LCGQDFDRDVAVQPRITRTINFSHPASADVGEDFVGAETNARG